MKEGLNPIHLTNNLMRVLLLKSWRTNIGNGIIENGAKVMLDRAFPNAEIIEVSGYPYYLSARTSSVNPSDLIHDLKNWVADLPVAGPPLKLVYNHIKKNDDAQPDDAQPGWVEKWSAEDNVTHPVEYIDADVAIVPGCVLRAALAMYYPALKSLSERDIPIVILGGASGGYTDRTTKPVNKFLKDLGVAGLITRDRHAYTNYSDSVQTAREGIDCGVFINSWYDPPQSTERFNVHTFDKISEPDIDSKNSVIRPHHAPFNNPEIGYPNWISGISKSAYFEPMMEEYFERDNIAPSDFLKDYLFYYRNADETHSDRIHSCIPALAYGNSAKFYFDTPRASLFDELETRDIIHGDYRSELVSFNKDRLEREKEREIDALKSMVKELL